MQMSLSRSRYTVVVLLPESFRGGCSFGVGLPDLSLNSAYVYDLLQATSSV